MVDAWTKRERRIDQRFAMLSCLLANIHRGPDDEPFEIQDFMPMTPDEREKFEARKRKASQQRFATAAGLRWSEKESHG